MEEAGSLGRRVWGGGAGGYKCSNHPLPPNPASGRLRPQSSQKITEVDRGTESKLIKCDIDYKIGRFNKTQGGREDFYK